MKLTIGYSPCPNDTFIFDALVHGKIDTEGLTFEPVLADVEELNQKAFRRELAVTKLSYHALLFARKDYSLLRSGSALGHRCGPLLIAKQFISSDKLNHNRIVIPGRFTTANFLLQFYLKKKLNAVSRVFSEIESSILSEEFESGVIIHESRFTFQSKGLVKIQDLGEYWEEKTGAPIPLGAIAVRNDLSKADRDRVERLIRRSVEFAWAHPDASQTYVKQHAQEMDDRVIAQHIDLYVNEYTRDLGNSGIAAVERLFKEADRLNLGQ